MIRAVLFDMGGTLDGEGLHWLDRFVDLYQQAGSDLPRERVRSAFDAAEARAAADDDITGAGIDVMATRHVGWQLEHLGIADAMLADRLVRSFVAPIRAAAAENRPLLAELAGRGFLLGVVSNGCGNVDVLCRDYGYSTFLSTIVDSRRAGISKPDPRIFELAAARLGVAPADTLVVGDSFDRDMLPARRAGMSTAWLQPAGDPAPDPTVVDVHLRRLADLPRVLLRFPAAGPIALRQSAS